MTRALTTGKREPWQRREVIGKATLYLGDCREVLPTIDRPDAIVTDPPYGQNAKLNTFYAGGSRSTMIVQRSGKALQLTANEWPDRLMGDEEPFDPSHLLSAADTLLLWGAHKFGDRLPRGRWLAWDKVPTGKVRTQGDGELAWTNVDPDAPMRIYRLLWDGLCVGAGARHEVTAGQKRVHPTQKPEVLMRWSLVQAKCVKQDVVCDPYMGAGSTGVAALQAGCDFIGIEAYEPFFETACRRIEDAQRQLSLFKEQAA